MCAAFRLFYFKKNYDVLTSRNPCFLLNKKGAINKNEMKSKMENPTAEPYALVHIRIGN